MTSTQNTRVKIWDIWIRLFHWSLAVAVIFLLISGETAWQFFEWHRLVGEFVLVLLLFRLCWSMVGSSNASLFKLIASPVQVIRHLIGLATGNVHAERGHNAAGGYAVLLMLILIGFQAVSGLFIADEDEFINGVFYGVLSSSTTDRLYSLHLLNASLIQAIVILHVVMVFLYLLRAGCNLIFPMVTGYMKWPEETTPPDLKFGHSLLGLILFAVIFAGVGWLFSWWF